MIISIIHENKHSPYSDDIIGDGGQIDHIIPRAYSRKYYQRIFNHEANLMYITEQDNSEKSEHRKRLNDLQPQYLNEVFKTTDINKIKQAIEKTVEKIQKNTPNTVNLRYQALDLAEQQALRHALFLDDKNPAYKYAFDLIQSQGTMNRVNGTQGWVVRQIIEIIKTKYPNIQPSIHKIDNMDIHDLRNDIEKEFPQYTDFQKPDLNDDKTKPGTTKQTPFSHVMDATLAFMVYDWQNQKQANKDTESQFKITLLNDVLNNCQGLPEIIPVKARSKTEQAQKKSLHNKKLHNDTMYAEKFIPLGVCNNEIYLGFSNKKGSYTELKLNDHLFNTYLLQYLEIDPVINSKSELIKHYNKNDKWINIHFKKSELIKFIHKLNSSEISTQGYNDKEQKDLLKLYKYIMANIRYVTTRKPLFSTDNTSLHKFTFDKNKHTQVNNIILPHRLVIEQIKKILDQPININKKYNELIKGSSNQSVPQTVIDEIKERQDKVKKLISQDDTKRLKNQIKNLEKKIASFNSQTQTPKIEMEIRQAEQKIKDVNIQIKQGMVHKRKRRAISFPQVAGNSGTRIRIKRRGVDGDIYQAVDIEKGNNIKYKLTDGFTEYTHMDFIKSKNIALAGKTEEKNDNGIYINHTNTPTIDYFTIKHKDLNTNLQKIIVSDIKYNVISNRDTISFKTTKTAVQSLIPEGANKYNIFETLLIAKGNKKHQPQSEKDKKDKKPKIPTPRYKKILDTWQAIFTISDEKRAKITINKYEDTYAHIQIKDISLNKDLKTIIKT